MGNSSEYLLISSLRGEHVVVVSIQVGCQGWGWVTIVKKNFLLYFMFQSILNIFFLLFLVGKINYLLMGGRPPPPFPENSAKLINSIFEPLPNKAKLIQSSGHSVPPLDS